MPEYDFSDVVAIVTGAARGQGRSHTLGFAEHGASVVAVDIGHDREDVAYSLGTAEGLAETVEKANATDGEAIAVEADISNPAAVEAAVEAATEEFGGIDVLANNAGVATPVEGIDIDERTWDAVLDINLRGTFLCTRAVARHMVERGEGGRIISTGSSASLIGQYGLAHYAASKHGIVGLTKTLALELAEHDITVNAVCPTAVETPMVPETMEVYGAAVFERIGEFGGPGNLLDEGSQTIPPGAVTDAYLWLASDAARYVTGVALPVDAGNTAK
jgi:NAD(P)-dependent dehydrogenase (short-subunit alcohol dehydrogenase family)